MEEEVYCLLQFVFSLKAVTFLSKLRIRMLFETIAKEKGNMISTALNLSDFYVNNSPNK